MKKLKPLQNCGGFSKNGTRIIYGSAICNFLLIIFQYDIYLSTGSFRRKRYNLIINWQ